MNPAKTSNAPEREKNSGEIKKENTAKSKEVDSNFLLIGRTNKRMFKFLFILYLFLLLSDIKYLF